MRVIHPLKMDLVGPWGGDLLHMVQGDSNTRIVELHLFSNGVPWEPLKVSSVVVAFKKPDQTKGLYKASYTLEQNKVQVVLAPQVLTAPGKVTVAVVLLDGEEDSLASFPFGIMVAQNPEVDAEASEDYFDYINPLVKQALEETLKAAETSAEKSEQAAAQAAAFAKTAEEKAALADQALALADQADKKVDTLREVVSKFHSNIVEEAKGDIITLDDASDMELAGLKIFGKTTQNGTPSPDSPVPLVSVGESVNVTVCGKNLIPKFTSTAFRGVTFTVNEDGSVTANGTSTGGDAYVATPISFKRGVRYTLSGAPATDGLTIWAFTESAWEGAKTDSGAGVTWVQSIDATGQILVQVTNGLTVKGAVYHPQLEIGSTATEYESYKEPTTVTVSTPVDSSGSPLLLPGIPVSSRGNYTDENGQQWICDEVDFARGVYVQRIEKVILDGSHNYAFVAPDQNNNFARVNYFPIVGKTGGSLKSTHYPMRVGTSTKDNAELHGNEGYFIIRTNAVSTKDEWDALLKNSPITIIYERAEEKSTPLSAEELAAYAVLHTHYPNTTILNDGGAGMEVKYVADTKLYIDRKFNELAAALVSKV